MAEKSQTFNGLYVFLTIIAILCLIPIFVGNTYNGPTQADIDSSVSKAVKVELAGFSIPSAVEIAAAVVIPEAQEIVIPKMENADNALLNEFLEREFEAEYNEIKSEAEFHAVEEFEEDNYEVVFDYLETLGAEVDEDSLDVDIDEIEVEVTKLGLEEDSDKCATVSIEFEVEYELEEGVRDDFELDLVAEFNVCYDEGDFGDEDVELISLA